MPINVNYQNTPLFVVATASFTINIDLKHVLVVVITLLAAATTGLMFYLLIDVFLLHHRNTSAPESTPMPTSFTVSRDGRGDFDTISAAVDAAPALSKRKFVIKIRSGVYKENVFVGPNKTNIVFAGDGINKTIVTSGRFAADESTISSTATIWVSGDGFVAEDITFENTAKPDQGPAAAASIESDRSAFYHCSFVGHEATLHARVHIQFYRDCDIYGAVDVIRGDATAVFQNCRIYARPPSTGQNITITAQERSSLNTIRGFSLQNCSVMAAPDLLRARLPTTAYLGRPRGNYSTVVVMQSFLDRLIDPVGWSDWQGRSALSTLYFGEYGNSGPGANVQRRVRWLGYRVLSSAQATNFTVVNFISGEEWLRSTGVPFTPGLY